MGAARQGASGCVAERLSEAGCSAPAAGGVRGAEGAPRSHARLRAPLVRGCENLRGSSWHVLVLSARAELQVREEHGCSPRARAAVREQARTFPLVPPSFSPAGVGDGGSFVIKHAACGLVKQSRLWEATCVRLGRVFSLINCVGGCICWERQ